MTYKKSAEDMCRTFLICSVETPIVIIEFANKSSLF